MNKYRKKPVVIEALKWEGDNAGQIALWADPNVKPHGLPKGWYIKSMLDGGVGLVIPTLEGDHTATVGDFIIRGVNGEFYPCKPDIFEKTYEPVTE